MIFISGFYNSEVDSIAKLFNNINTYNCSYLTQLLTAYRTGKESWQTSTRHIFKTSDKFINFNKSLFDNYFQLINQDNKTLIHHDDMLVDKFIELNELYGSNNIAKFILVVRDPRDSIALSMDSLKIDNPQYLFELYMNSYENFIRYSKEKKLNNVLTIQYEDIINNPETITNQIYEFSGIKPDITNFKNNNTINKYKYILDNNTLEMLAGARPKLKTIFGKDIFCDDIDNKYEYKYDIVNQKDTIETIKHLYENASLDELIKISKQAIEQFPCYEFYKALALSYTEIGDVDNGYKYLAGALKYNINSKSDADLYICQGMLFEMQSKFDKSLTSFKKSLKINPNLSDTHNHIARILQKLGKFNQSKKYSKKSVKLDGTFNQAKTTLEQTILNEVTYKPHKVFCIGFNRTGSTSMGEVFKILEYNVKGEVKKQEEWMSDNSSNNKQLESIKKFILSISEDYNAFYHEPWNQFYKELDLKYPDSKFILTIRDEHSWLKSFNNYFKESGNNNWTPFLLGNYDTKDINSISITNPNKYFTSKFKDHNQSVIDYFKDTPEKLLIMDIFNGDGWDKLCPFLGYDKSNLHNTPFPHSNKGLYFPT